MPWPPSGCLWRGAGYMPASPNSLTHGRDLAQATGQPAERPEARPSRNWPSPEPSSQRFHAPDGSARPDRRRRRTRHRSAVAVLSALSARIDLVIASRSGAWGAGSGLDRADRGPGRGLGATRGSGSGAGPAGWRTTSGTVRSCPIETAASSSASAPPGASARAPSSSARRRCPRSGTARRSCASTGSRSTRRTARGSTTRRRPAAGRHRRGHARGRAR